MDIMELWEIVDKLSLVLALAIAVWWFNRREQRSETRAEQHQLERDADRRGRFEALERRAEECDVDRKRMHEQLSQLRVELAEVKTILRSRQSEEHS